jgi:Fe-S cluster biogenesis protein NfuA
MFIQTEDTPNPLTMKFLPGRVVVETPLDITDPAKANISPLASSLFAIKGVSGVFLGKDFISVTKDESPDWASLRPSVLAAIMDHFVQDKPVLTGDPAMTQGLTDVEEDDVVTRIKELLDLRIRPAVAQDGGDVAFERYEDGIVYLRLKGACAGCPSATATLKFGIEQMLKHFIPEIQEVRRVL